MSTMSTAVTQARSERDEEENKTYWTSLDRRGAGSVRSSQRSFDGKPTAAMIRRTSSVRERFGGSRRQVRLDLTNPVVESYSVLRRGGSAVQAMAVVDDQVGGRNSFGGGHKRLGRTPSSPAALFTKVKERIREKVFETSVEWPHMAAIVQERRQRATDAFEARMSIRKKDGLVGDKFVEGREADCLEENSMVVLNHKPGRRLRILSAPLSHQRADTNRINESGDNSDCTSSFDKSLAKYAYRRRSISEDTYNRQYCGGLNDGTAGRGGEMARVLRKSSADTSTGGIICSDDDIRAIVCSHRRSLISRSGRPRPQSKASTDTIGDVVFFVGEESIPVTRGSTSRTSDAGLPRTSAVICPTSSTSFENEIFDQSQASITKSGRLVDTDRLKHAGQSHARSLMAQMTIHQEDTSASSRASDAFESSMSLSTNVVTEEEIITENCDSQKEDFNSTIHDIIFDEHGQTWDIYGADFDAEILGQAIQGHLENIIKRGTDMKENSCMRCKGVETEAIESNETEVNCHQFRKEKVSNGGGVGVANGRGLGVTRSRGLGAVLRLLSLVASRNGNPRRTL